MPVGGKARAGVSSGPQCGPGAPRARPAASASCRSPARKGPPSPLHLLQQDHSHPSTAAQLDPASPCRWPFRLWGRWETCGAALCLWTQVAHLFSVLIQVPHLFSVLIPPKVQKWHKDFSECSVSQHKRKRNPVGNFRACPEVRAAAEGLGPGPPHLSPAR